MIGDEDSPTSITGAIPRASTLPDEAESSGMAPADSAGNKVLHAADTPHADATAPRARRRSFRNRERGWWMQAPAPSTTTSATAPAVTDDDTGAGQHAAGPIPLLRQAQQRARYIAAAIIAVILIAIALSRILGTTTNGPSAAPNAPAAAFSPVNGAPITIGVEYGEGAGLVAPREAVALPDGHIIVADTGQSSLAVLDAHGRRLSTIHAGAAPLQQPFAVVATRGGIDVLDAQRGSIERYSMTGRFEQELIHDGTLNDGRGLAAGPDGELFVANPLLNSVVVLTPEGAIERKFSSTLGAGADQFDQPSDVAVAANGTIYVLDNVNKRIKALKPSGALAAQWPAPQSDTLHSVHLLALPDGRVLASDPSGALLVYALGVANPTRLPLGGAGQSLGAVEPLGLSLTPRGQVLVTDGAGNRLLVVPIPS